MYLTIAIPLLCLAIRGVVCAEVQTFVVQESEKRNLVTFESQAPLERISGTTHAVRGEIRVDREDLSWCSGELRVRLNTLDTGIELRNKQMRNQYLETRLFPEVVFEVVKVISAEPTRLDPGVPSRIVLEGVVRLHGVERRERVEVDATYFPESEATRLKMSGNLLRVQARFDVILGDYDIPIPKLVALQLDENVRLLVDVTGTDRPALDRDTVEVKD